jgi:Calx-beta domain
MRLSWLIAIAMLITAPLHAANYIVNQGGSQGDADVGDGFCDRNATAGNQNECTLHAAIQQGNAVTGPHNITFDSGIQAITSATSLLGITAPVNIDGSNPANVASGGRVDFNGGNAGCFSLAETTTAFNPNGARGSTITNLVIRNCSGDGISLSGHGYTVSNNRIGTNPGGSASDINNDANTGHGVVLSGTVAPPASLPNIQSLIDDPPTNFGEIAAFSALVQTALTVIANPTTITGNLISGNGSDGIQLFSPSTVNVFILGNTIGTNQSATVSVPNGRGAGNGAGIRLASGAYGNFIGPGNIVSGQNEDASDDGISIESGAVLLPNFVMGNLVGVGSTPVTDIGNGDVGIFVNTRPDTDGIGADNPTGYSLFLGPANTVSDNRSDNGGGSLDAVSGDASAGILITGTSANTRVYGNFIGMFQFPAGGSPIGSLDTGNAGNGIVVTSSNHLIGGSEAFEANLILHNGRHGILVKGSDTADVTIRGNFIGVSDPTGLGLFDFGNTGDGIHVFAASSLTIGGPGGFDDNVIAANGRHGIALRSGAPANGWANLIQRNQIYGNNQNVGDGIAALGIDLERIVDAPDPIPDPIDPDPNTLYANYGQNQPAICTGGPGEPAACAGATPPNFGGSNTTLQWTIEGARPSSTFRIEFFSTLPDSQTFLSEQIVNTDAAGVLTGGGCVAGLCTSSVGGSTNTQSSQLMMTATDLFPTDVPPIGLGAVNLPSNNTSEFSAPVMVAQPGELRFSLAAYSVGEAGPVATIAVQRVNGSDGVVGVTYATADGSANSPADYTGTTNTLSWADGDAADKTFDISIVADMLDETNETVALALSLPTGNAVIGTPGNATLTITDDDATPTLSIGDVSLAEGNSGSTAFVFPVTLSAASGQTVTVNYATADGSATQPADYAAASGTLTFMPGDSSEDIAVNVVGETTVEPDQAFVVNLTLPGNATFADDQATGTILDDDASGAVFSVNDVTAVETNAGTTTFTFTVTRDITTGAASVDAATADVTANAGSDYVAIAATTLNFADGIATQPFAVTVNGDVTIEADEIFNVLLSNASAGTSIGDGTGVGTISNDDAAGAVFSINDMTAVETNAGTTTFTFTVTRDITTGAATVDAATADVTANAGSDYIAIAATTLNFADGIATQPFAVTVNGDVAIEADETFNVLLSNASAGTSIGDGSGLGTISNDDAAGAVFSVNDVTALETNAGTTTFTFTVTRDITTGAASVDAATADVSATASSDYVAIATTTLNFADGIATQPFTVTVNGDISFEADEAFNVLLSNASAGTSIGDGSGLGTISNDDGQPTISIADIAAVEGNAGNAPFAIAVTLSNPSSQTITVSAASADGTATAGSDYSVLAATTVTFVPGDVAETVTVNVTGDTTPEADETFVVNLTAPGNATIADNQATATILDDDTSAVFSINDVTAIETNAGTTTFTFTVARSLTAGAASVQAATADVTANAGSDYVAIATTTLNFADGIATQPFAVTVNGDATVEPDETFNVLLSNASAGTSIADGIGVGTISNDDAAGAAFSINDVSAIETDAGTTTFTFTVTRSLTAGAASVQATTSDGSATAGSDYVAIAAAALNFADGIATLPFAVTVNGDSAVEPDETFNVLLSNPSAGTSIGAGSGVGIILNDDGMGAVFSIDDVALIEGNAGTSTLTFTVTRSLTSGAASVQAATSDVTALAGSDYVAIPATTLTFADGIATQPFAVTINGDLALEADETFNVLLSNASVGASIADDTGVGTITNDDIAGAVFSINDVSAIETNAGTTTLTFTVTRSLSTGIATVQATTSDGSATAGSDYIAIPATTLTFADGIATQPFTVTINGDAINEPDETFNVLLSSPSAPNSIGDATGIATITNDDLAAGNGTVAVPAGGTLTWMVLLALVFGIGLVGLRSRPV